VHQNSTKKEKKSTPAYDSLSSLSLTSRGEVASLVVLLFF